MPSSSCVVKPLPFSLHVFLVQPNVTLWRPLFTFPFWLIALAAECIVLDGFQHSLWSLFPVLYLLAWKQLKKCRCFFIEWAGRHSVYRFSLLLGFSPCSVALKVSSGLQYKVFFLSTSFKQSKVDVRQFLQFVFGSLCLCELAFLICKIKKVHVFLTPKNFVFRSLEKGAVCL